VLSKCFNDGIVSLDLAVDSASDKDHTAWLIKGLVSKILNPKTP
jgi:hypothetical protein